jgi:hypothetical protein
MELWHYVVWSTCTGTSLIFTETRVLLATGCRPAMGLFPVLQWGFRPISRHRGRSGADWRSAGTECMEGSKVFWEGFNFSNKHRQRSEAIDTMPPDGHP